MDASVLLNEGSSGLCEGADNAAPYAALAAIPTEAMYIAPAPGLDAPRYMNISNASDQQVYATPVESGNAQASTSRPTPASVTNPNYVPPPSDAVYSQLDDGPMYENVKEV